MKKKILALVLAFTMCFGTTMTANAAMIVKNDMSALGASNVLDKTRPEHQRTHCSMWLQNSRLSTRRRILMH